MSSIKSIRRVRITDQTLWNLAVKDDESFVANGIVVHNCKSYLEPNFKGAKSNPKVSGAGLRPTGTEKQIEKAEKQINLSEPRK